MKKLFFLSVLVLSVSYFLNAPKSDNTMVTLSNIEALASGERIGSEYCTVGYICYVIADARRYCGNCLYEYVNPQGDGSCDKGSIFD